MVVIDGTDIRGTDAWWLHHLLNKMNAPAPRERGSVAYSARRNRRRRDWLDLLWSYHSGRPPLPEVHRRGDDVVRDMLRRARANYALLCVEALLDRVDLVGVRVGAEDDSDGDDKFREILAANGGFVTDALTYTFALGEGYIIVGDPDDNGIPRITGEDPRDVVVETDPTDSRRVLAALKQYRDAVAGDDVAHLYLPSNDYGADRVLVARRGGGGSGWQWDEAASGDLPVQGFGVPVIPLPNRLGMGEFEPHLDLLDRINKMIADRLWISSIQAFRQRALKSDKESPGLPDTDDSGNPIDYRELFQASPDALWELPPGVDIWESTQLDWNPILQSVRDDVKEFAAVTRTPLFMFTPDAAAGSAEGASLMREGLVFKAEDRIARFTPAILRAARIALAYSGRPDAAGASLQAMWAPAERFSLEQRGAAATQAKAAGVPWDTLMSDVMQFLPETVARMRQERMSDLMFTALQQPESGNGDAG